MCAALLQQLHIQICFPPPGLTNSSLCYSKYKACRRCSTSAEGVAVRTATVWRPQATFTFGRRPLLFRPSHSQQHSHALEHLPIGFPSPAWGGAPAKRPEKALWRCFEILRGSSDFPIQNVCREKLLPHTNPNLLPTCRKVGPGYIRRGRESGKTSGQMRKQLLSRRLMAGAALLGVLPASFASRLAAYIRLQAFGTASTGAQGESLVLAAGGVRRVSFDLRPCPALAHGS